MSTHQAPKPQQTRIHVRRAMRALAVGVLGAALVPTVALGDTPSSSADAPHVSGLEYLVVLVLIPLGLFAVVSLLAALPSMIRDKGYEPGQSWRSDPEWFGGPRKGIDAAEGAAAIEAGEGEQGGTSGKW